MASAETRSHNVDPKRALKSDLHRVHALILDFDGLVIDTETPIFEIWRSVYREHGQELLLEDWRRALGTAGGFDPVSRLEALVHVHIERDRLTRAVRARHRAACDTQPVLPGVVEVIDSGRMLGLGVALASSSPGEWVRHWLEFHGLRDRFDAVCVRENVERVKPAPDLFLLAASRMGAPPAACLVFEDSPNGIRAARRAGMPCVAVTNAITRELRLPSAALVLPSLAGMSLIDILRRLQLFPASRPRPASRCARTGSRRT
ncbi:MAG: HAD family hydrolase [Vicinamibacteria bacterium]|nr:HAD family hydrolase [Vicinamibacteria bacterium]